MLGKRMKKLRTDLKLTQNEVANGLNIPRGTYAHYELDKREPDNEMLKKIAGFFKVTTDYLLGNSNSKNASSRKAPAEYIKFQRDEFRELTLEEIDKLAIFAKMMKEERENKD